MDIAPLSDTMFYSYMTVEDIYKNVHQISMISRFGLRFSKERLAIVWSQWDYNG